MIKYKLNDGNVVREIRFYKDNKIAGVVEKLHYTGAIFVTFHMSLAIEELEEIEDVIQRVDKSMSLIRKK